MGELHAVATTSASSTANSMLDTTRLLLTNNSINEQGLQNICKTLVGSMLAGSDLDLLSHNSHGHDPYTCKRSMSKVTRFKSWSGLDGQTDGRTDGGDCITSHANFLLDENNIALWKKYETNLVAEVFESRLVAVEGVSHEVVGERQMLGDVFYRPLVEEEIQQALVTAVETANFPRELHQPRECIHTRPAADSRGSDSKVLVTHIKVK